MKQWKLILMIAFIAVASAFFVGIVIKDTDHADKTPAHSEAAALSENHAYYMKNNDGNIIIYNNDHSVFEFTDLQPEFLPDHIVNELTQGVYFQSQEDLYEFLETYSS